MKKNFNDIIRDSLAKNLPHYEAIAINTMIGCEIEDYIKENNLTPEELLGKYSKKYLKEFNKMQEGDKMFTMEMLGIISQGCGVTFDFALRSKKYHTKWTLVKDALPPFSPLYSHEKIKSSDHLWLTLFDPITKKIIVCSGYYVINWPKTEGGVWLNKLDYEPIPVDVIAWTEWTKNEPEAYII